MCFARGVNVAQTFSLISEKKFMDNQEKETKGIINVQREYTAKTTNERRKEVKKPGSSS